MPRVRLNRLPRRKIGASHAKRYLPLLNFTTTEFPCLLLIQTLVADVGITFGLDNSSSSPGMVTKIMLNHSMQPDPLEKRKLRACVRPRQSAWVCQLPTWPVLE